ncbi:hypothetical protein [Sansalvadorimonas verongulae]|uniref:hypothetical protein n=1 Tax=Sansalvadorimonas verongulae TaxID=2172824 RepID=UPI0012BCE5EF|nr:hypothetical protein [Sansalvadorimonas verongulae]MTI11854.1 hypothetical protein [Sansalvadorimonas verongulae]
MATTNPWKQFQGLLPKASRIIGTVASHNSNGTSTITLRDGVTMTAKGQSVSVGQRAFVEGGEIVREVPDLPNHKIQV